MPTRTTLHGAVRRIFHRSPAIEAAALGLLDAWCQIALLPFRRARRHGRTSEDAAIVISTDRYNRAAEQYFAAIDDPSFLLAKPYSEPAALPKHLIDAGVLLSALRVAPGDVVMELGAGSCWLSHMLNRYGCRTMAVDVSATALALGRRLFEADARTNWHLHPEFLSYDGHRLPAADASCDGVVINDAFHHVPNQRELLMEMQRVLRPHGIVAMSEPGRGHGATAQSVREASDSGVLENELVLEDVAGLARDCGFASVQVVLASPFAHAAIDARELGAFMGGRGFARYWQAYCAALEQHHYITCAKTALGHTTRRPSRPSARIRGDGVSVLSSRAGKPLTTQLTIANTGDTTWLGGDTPRSGWTRVGAHLYRDDGTRALVDFDWWRQALPRDVAPGETVTLHAELPALRAAGAYIVSVDLVIEQVAWFADFGGEPATLRIEVR
jgi:SAM-dependent methyltransferase